MGSGKNNSSVKKEPLNEHGEPIDENVYRQFARVYPHECYDADPERFWNFFHSRNPDVTREQMIEALEQTRQ